MTEDIVRQFGFLALGSRFKRIGEQMQADVQRLLKAEGIMIPAGLLPTLAALDRHGEMTIGELAESLGIAQPGATRNISQLIALGMVRSLRRSRDLRQKSILLTKKGEAIVAITRRNLWPQIEQAVAGICTKLDGGLLSQLDAIEDALKQESLASRVGTLKAAKDGKDG